MGTDGDICAYIRFIYADMGQNKAKKSPAAPRYIARTPRRAFFVFVIILLLSRNADNLGYYYFAGNCRFCDSKLTARRCSGLLCTAANRVRYCQFSFC